MSGQQISRQKRKKSEKGEETWDDLFRGVQLRTQTITPPGDERVGGLM